MRCKPPLAKYWKNEDLERRTRALHPGSPPTLLLPSVHGARPVCWEVADPSHAEPRGPAGGPSPGGWPLELPVR